MRIKIKEMEIQPATVSEENLTHFGPHHDKLCTWDCEFMGSCTYFSCRIAMLQICFKKWESIGGWSRKDYIITWQYWCSLIQTAFLSSDSLQGLPHRPVEGEDVEHPGCNQREVHAVPVQPSLQDPPPVTHVPVRCHARRRPQLAVPQHHRGTGTGGRRGTVNPFILTFPGSPRDLETFGCSGAPAFLRLEDSEALLPTLISSLWPWCDCGCTRQLRVPVAEWGL